MITETKTLALACAHFSRAPFITIDTEFLRETTFWPKLCIVQIADEERVEIIDALAPGIDLAPLFELMANPAVTKVFHAARQDIEIFWHLGKVIPQPLFDTQIAAMVLGFGESVSYDQLVQAVTGVHLDKSSRFTDWSRRPLSQAQLDYAAADVTHLRDVYKHLARQLDGKERWSWIEQEMAVLSSPDTYIQAPENAWKKLKARIKKPRELACLIEVAAWREREAQNKNVPRGRILKDEQIADIALRHPTTADALSQLRGIPNGFERSRSGQDVLEAVKRAMALDQAELPKIEKHRSAPHNASATIELLRVLLKLISERDGVAPKILASSDDLEHIAMKSKVPVPALEGWRYEMFGQHALALCEGKLALTLQHGKIATIALT